MSGNASDRARILGVLALCTCVSFAGAARAEDDNPTKPTFDSAVAAYDAGRFDDAFRIFSSIEDDNIAAMYNVALMERRGQGTKKDPKAAEEMYQRGAEAGDARAAADLGEMLLKGEAGPPDPAGAVPFLTEAAAAHHPIAQFELGELYETGQGVQKDLEVARMLYKEAAERDVPGAKERLAALPPAPPETAPGNGNSENTTGPAQ